MPAPRTQATRTIAVGSPLGEDKLLLKIFTATEQMGRLFRIELELLSEDGSIAPVDVLGQNMTVRVQSPGGGVDGGTTRYFNGYVARWHQSPPSGGMARYRATLVPWMWLMSRAADCRIFQEMTVPDIILKVFRDHGFSDFESKLNESYPTLEYCVQYRETDLNFVSRLMEQSGIYYFFKHEDGKHTLVLADSISNHVVEAGYDEIQYHEPEPQIVGKEFITDFYVEQHVQTGRYMHTDFDFTKPATNLETKLEHGASYAGGGFEIFDYPGEYTVTADGEKYAKVRMEEMQAEHEIAHGQSDSRGITVGSKFRLSGYPRDSYNVEWTTTSTTIHAEADSYQGAGGQGGGTSVYSCQFRVIPSTVPFRAARVTPKPLISGPQTAIVCGKSGEEIWTDKYGRVKVLFHWDRHGKNDETASCWVRVAQVWAGKKWGGMHIPRIGQEVIVEFLEGDPDRPIITGRVYNGVEMPPYALPDNATMSGVKSNSSKGGGGFNEFRFEDKKGEEQIFTHAEKDMHTRVKNDRLEIVLNNSHSIIKKDAYAKIEQDQHEMIKRDRVEDIGRDHSLTIARDQMIRVNKTLSLTVAEDVAEKFDKNHSEITKEKIFYQGDEVVIEGKTNVTIHVGSSYIAINADGIKIATDGEIVLDSKKDLKGKTLSNLSMEATQAMTLKGTTGLTAESTATAEVKSPSTTVKGDGMLTLKGGMVMIN